MAPVHFLLSYVVGCPLGIIVHELGHWLLAVMVGISIRRVTIGTGPMLFSRRFEETSVELACIVTSGFVSPYAILSPNILAELVYVLGGVAANLAVLLVLLLLPRSDATPEWIVDGIWGLGWAQLWIVAYNLFPRRFGSGRLSDGALILALLKTRRSMFGAEARTAAYGESLEPYAMPGEDLTRHSRASARIAYNIGAYRNDDAPDRGAALDGLLRDISSRNLRRAEELLILDVVVTTHVLRGEGPLRGKLNALSLRALERAPELATLRGSRGAALVEIGRAAEGKAMLAPLADGPASFDTILSTLFLARACLKLGEHEEASRRLERARAMLCFYFDPSAARLFERVEAELYTRAEIDGALRLGNVSVDGDGQGHAGTPGRWGAVVRRDCVDAVPRARRTAELPQLPAPGTTMAVPLASAPKSG